MLADPPASMTPCPIQAVISSPQLTLKLIRSPEMLPYISKGGVGPGPLSVTMLTYFPFTTVPFICRSIYEPSSLTQCPLKSNCFGAIVGVLSGRVLRALAMLPPNFLRHYMILHHSTNRQNFLLCISPCKREMQSPDERQFTSARVGTLPRAFHVRLQGNFQGTDDPDRLSHT
jgi:hypothetical protein